MAISKNKYGQYFTRKVITDYMTALITHNKDAVVCEPSCGKGAFLSSLINRGFHNITAYEIDTTLEIPYDFVKFESFLSVPTSEKYDVVIGNPPYVRWKNLEPELKSELESNVLWNRYFNSLCDYLFIFILKSIEHLNEGGELLFICSEYWLNTTNSQTLRDYMCRNGYISDIYHFKEAPLFDGVTASLIIFRYVKTQPKPSSVNFFMYNQTGAPTLEDLLSHACFEYSIIPQFSVGERWVLATAEKQEKIKRLETACSFSESLFESGMHRIGDYCDIGNGMVSGLDKAFKLPAGISLSPHEQKATISVLKAKELEQFSYEHVSKYIYVTEQYSEEEFAITFPTFSKQLLPFKDDLDKRYSYGRDIPYWEFVFPRNYNLFNRPGAKIFIPCKERISNKDYFRFTYAEEGIFPLQDVTGIVPKRSCKESVEYILAYLNLNEVFEWLCINGIVKGAIVEFSEAPIASIPYRPINWENPKEVNAHNTITQEVKGFLTDKNQTHIERIKNTFNSTLL